MLTSRSRRSEVVIWLGSVEFKRAERIDSGRRSIMGRHLIGLKYPYKFTARTDQVKIKIIPLLP